MSAARYPSAKFWKAIAGDLVALDAKRVLNDLGSAVAVGGADARSRKLVMRVLLADDRTQTQPKIRLLAGTDKSPASKEKALALGDRGRRRAKFLDAA